MAQWLFDVIKLVIMGSQKSSILSVMVIFGYVCVGRLDFWAFNLTDND